MEETICSHLLNRSNKIVATLVKYVFEFEDGFKKEILSQIKKRLSAPTSSLILFGSVARGEEDYSSDLDLCIVYSKNKTGIENIVSELRDKLYDDYKVTLAPFYITEDDFKKRAKKKLSPVNDILNDGFKISGKSIREIIK